MAPLGPALVISTSVIGVGILVLPGLLSQSPRVDVLLASLWHLVLGALLVATLGLVSIRIGQGCRVADLADWKLGTAWRTAVEVWYVMGFTAGQAAVVLVAGYYTGAALGAGGRLTVLVGLIVVVGAAVSAARGFKIRGGARYVLVAFIVALLIAGRLFQHGQVVDSDSYEYPGGIGSTAFLLTFAFIGWEQALRLGTRIARSGAILFAAATCTAVVGLVYCLSGTGYAAGSEEAERIPSALVPTSTGGGRVVLGLAAVACTLLCASNISTTGEMAARIWWGGTAPPRSLQASSLLTGTAVLSVLGVAHMLNLSVATLLLVPNAMAVAIYTVALVAALRTLRGLERALGATALVAVGTLASFGGRALLAPIIGLSLAFALMKARDHLQAEHRWARMG